MLTERNEVIRQFDVPALGEVAKFGTDYFLLKIKFLAKCKREFTTKFAIESNLYYSPQCKYSFNARFQDTILSNFSLSPSPFFSVKA